LKKTVLILNFIFLLLLSGFASDRYWVGGTGNWSDVSHWSDTNGGTAGVSVPTETDNVFFTSTSFSAPAQSVTIDGPATCANLTFTGDLSNTSVEGIAGTSLSVHGSMKLQKGVSFNFNGDLVFKSSTYSSLTSNGVTLNSNIYIDLSGGTLSLIDNLTTSPSSSIYFKAGTFSTNGKMLNSGSVVAKGNSQRFLQLGQSSVIIHDKWQLNETENLILEGGKAKIIFVNKMTASNFQSKLFPYGSVKSMQNLPYGVVITEIVLNKCSGDCKSKMVATVSGGTGPYIYTWILPGGGTVIDGPTMATTDTLTGVCEGKFYSVFADDVGNFDAVVSDTKLAQSFSPVGIAFNTVATKCNGSCDGKATAISVGGTNPIAFVWSNGVTGTVNNNICAGTYTVTATDANGCSATNSATVNQPTAINANGTKTNVSCFGVCTGSASVAPTGGTAPITYLWSNGSTAATISALCAATYTVTVKDKNNCTVTFTPTITQPAAALSAATVPANASCFGICDGAITLTPAGGTVAYTYLWSNAATSKNVSALCAATYTVTVTDANSCTKTATATITEPIAITAAPTGTNIICFSACNGTVDAHAGGGSPAYTYAWSPGGATTATVGSLCPNTYSVTVTDSKGCSATSTVTITEPAVLKANVSKTNITCNALCNGTATSVPTGGTPNYTYAWSNASTAATQAGLCVNTYTVTVKDANNCTATGTASITQPALLTIAPNLITNVTCNAACDGGVTTTTTGGTSPYNYLWSNAVTNSNLSNVCAASYTVTVTDVNGCTATTSATITQPNALTATVTPSAVLCNSGCNGTATASVNGGSAPFSYLWNTTLTTPIISSLCAATYTVTVTDANNCTATSSATITQPTALALSVTPTQITCSGLCNGSVSSTPSGGTINYTYSWSNAATAQTISALCVGGYTLTVTDANGCTKSSNTTLIAPPPLSATMSASNLSCNGVCNGSASASPGGGVSPYGYAWSNAAIGQTASALCQGTYTVTVSDANTCQTTQTITITQPTALTASAGSTTTSCGLCNGTATVSPLGGSPGYNYTWSNAQTTPTAVGLCIATYTVTVSDINNCSATGTASVASAVNITVTATPSTLSCFAGCDGIATANASGGVSPYTYTWTNGSASLNATGLCAGTYTVTATDASGCTSTATATFVNPPVIVPNVSHTNASCNSVCDGTATAAPAGGTGAYTYTWSTAATTATASALCAGVYTVTVEDAKACTMTSTVTVTEPAALSDNKTITTASCGLCDGKISVAPSGGAAAYTYAWSTGSSAATITNLCVGNYTLTLTAGGVCQSVFNYSMSNTAGPVLTKARTNTLCNGSCNGIASVVAAGAPAFTYAWSTGSTAATINGLCAATFTISVRDGIGCVTVDTVLIKQPAKLDPNPTTANVSCGGAGDGAIILVPGGGTPAYTYSWSNSATTSTITNLVPGPYTFTVTDSKGCDSINTITITEPLVLTADVPFSTDVTCKGACDGSGFATGSGGTAPYTYTWSNGAILNLVVNLCPNTYTVTVTDANGCVATSTVTIIEPALALTATIGETDVSCNGGSDGTTFVNASGGTPTYTYSWNPGGQTAATAIALFPGPYNITITDANGCTFVAGTTVNQPAAITFVSGQTDVSCNAACDGSLNVTAGGGTAPFSYLWSNAATGQTASGLCAGPYAVTATDAKGCTNSKNFTITEPAILISNVAVITPVNCTSLTSGTVASSPSPSGGTPAYTYTWSNGASTQTNSSIAAGTYTVTVTDSKGCIDTQSVTLLPAVPITVLQAVADANCGVCNGTIDVAPSGGTPAYTYSWNAGATTSSLVGLCAGNYTLTVTDVNGCTSQFIIPLNNTGGPTGEVVVSTNDSCNAVCDGTVTITPIGGTLPYTYSWTDIANTTNTRTGLCAGTYTLVVTDANGCIRNSSVTITEPNPIIITPTITDVTCSGKCDGAVILTSSGGTVPYVYSWNTGASGATQTLLCAATYTVTLTDANFCTSTKTVVIGTSQVLTALVAQTNPLCNALCTGTADVTMNGGTNPYTFTWSNGVAVSSASNLCANTFTISVTDANGCNITQAIAITEPAALTVATTITTATCGICNGQIGLTPSGGTGTYTYIWGTGASAQTVSGLCAGVYALDVSDANACVQSFNIPLNNTNGPGPSTIATTDVSCFGTNDGTATVTPNGGTPAYTFSWLTTGQTVSSVTGLAGGVNLVQITDANGCIRTDSVVINSPTQIIPNEVITNATCGVSDGQISVSPTGGVSPYTYTWSTGSSAATITGLGPANYTITVTDASGCTQTADLPLSNNNAPTLTVSVQHVGCNAACNGSAVVTPAGGLAPYFVVWSNAATGNTASGLCAGTYNVNVTDANGCVAISNVTITEPFVLALTAPATQQVSCSLACNGTAAALPTGGTLPYTYSWSNGSSATTIGNLCAATYVVSLTDANGCIATQAITIVPSPTPFTVTPNVTNATCGLCDGVASVTVNGGTAPFSYLWSNAATGATVSALCAAVYSIDIKDASGCTAGFFLPVSNAGGPTSSGKVITNILCNGQCNGGATLAPVGGTLPYTYLWLPSMQTTSSISNVCAGMGFVQVTDSNGCILTDTINITEPAAFAANENITPPSGCGVSDGSVTLNPSGGTAPYTYTWSGAMPATNTQSGLGAGLYTVTITDAVACVQSTVIAINNTTAPTLSDTVINVSCFSKCDGKAIVRASGGTPGYTYLWNDPSSSPTDTANALCAGTYFVQVTDAAGCIISSSTTITEPIQMVLSSPVKKSATCFGVCDGSETALPAGGTLPYMYMWSTTAGTPTITNLCAGNYTITVMDAAGCTVQHADSISSPIAITVLVTPVDANCNNTNDGSVSIVPGGGTPAYTYAWTGPGAFASTNQNIAGLYSGKYPLTVTDSHGCQQLDTAIVNATINVIAKAGNDTSFCQGASITLNGSGSLSALGYKWLQMPALTNVGGTVTTTVIPPSGTTSYLLVASNGVCSDTDMVVVVANPLPVVDAGPEQTIFPLQTTMIGGTPTTNSTGATFSWTPGKDLTDSIAPNPDATPLSTTLYKVVVKDINGCTSSDTVRITVIPEIKFNNGFTPNGDGKNDTWIIDNIIKFPKCMVEIYNRWGDLLFTSVGYGTPWDGKYKGGDLPVGTYYYVIKLNDPLYPTPYTGPITIMR
jgi:gliding motility-associated-like protein